ncbi:hydrocephalus-inducing protein homolog isoform X2 [Betta splendens]|uniref:Hydrocephalus-inducing protein homolog isoform X2 n=1 Tax=Betta splendens TaxID=158456 RepID=A0A6P7MQ95_BETSP|nr:hydrocephalus-inducing protein homolog isoform X2 [Betta splendens]
MFTLNNLKLVQEDKPRRVNPSAYIQEMLQSTEERLANTNEIYRPHIVELLDMRQSTNHKLSTVDLDQALFQPYPSELVFQNFTPSQTYKLPLCLFNNDKVSRNVKVELQDSEYFHVVGSENAHSKVAPGLYAAFTVIFTPLDSKDYHHSLVCVTERERFVVPVRAIGPRALLDFRDEFNLPLCVVKASTERTHLVRNIGNSKARFKLHTDKPFSVTPSSGTLDVGESLQVTVEFHPMTIGDHSQDMLLHYHTGEDVYISLYGVCEELNIYLDPDSVLLKNTYISLANVHTVSIANTSEIPLRYHWSAWSSRKDLQGLRESSGLQHKEEKEHSQVLSRAMQEQTGQDHLLSLSDSCIMVEPAEGEIWPKITTHFKIVFKPEEAKVYQQTIYCDVTGREFPLPLTIKGEGMGPKLKLKYNLMDMKNVFIGDKYSFEVPVSNLGLIDASFRLSSPDTTFGGCFSFSPEEGVVPSGACQTVEVTFHSRILGTFSEDLLLTVTGQPQPLTLTFRGRVIGPTFHFNVSELNFGDVAFGFPQTLVCTLFNTSFVPMTFALRILGDGSGPPSITSSKQVSERSRNSWRGSAANGLHIKPVEFTVNPAVGSVRAMSDINIMVTLCSNTVKQYRLTLVVDVDGVGKEILSLPVRARCVVPEIVVETPVLDFQRCFLEYPYHQQVRLSNHSDLPVCYGMLDQQFEENPSVVFGSFSPRGVIYPHSTEELPVFLLAKVVGMLNHTLSIAVFGSMQSPLEVALSCIGQGPVVLIQSPQLNFGKIPVLTDITRTLLLSNQSPIPAHFTACMINRRSSWRVEPSEGKVPSQSQLELKVVAYLKDTLSFQDSLEVCIQNSQTYMVPLSATGTGTTIVTDSPLGQHLDLGTHFSHGLCQYNFKLTNHGQRIQRLYWGTDGFLPLSKTQKGKDLSRGITLPPISAPKMNASSGHGSFPTLNKEKTVFTITPTRVELFPGCSVDMRLTGTSDTPKVVQERLVCRGIVGNQASYDHIMSLNVTCHFVAPVLSISSRCLNFYIEKAPGKSLTPLYEKLVLKNVSALCLSMELSLVEPFSLCEAPSALNSATTKCMVLGDGKQAELWVCFNPACCKDQVSRVVNELLEIRYQGHPQQDMVELHAEVHFPNLHFSSTAVDFGCVLNCTDTSKYVTITNCSPLPVSYKWTFLEDHKESSVRAAEKQEEEEWKPPESDTEELQGSSRRLSNGSDPICVNKVFDIMPWYGHLQPKGQQTVTFVFYSHEDSSREVLAQCHVDNGPTYQIKLKGESSVIQYSLNSTCIDFGLQLFDHVGKAEMTITNTGRMGFNFSIEHPNRQAQDADEKPGRHRKKNTQHLSARQQKDEEQNDERQEVRPGMPIVIPSKGYIAAGMVQSLRVLYLPGIPEVFEKQFQLQVAFLPPQDITLIGEGVFPRIRLNLPQNMSEECYRDVVQQTRAAVDANTVKEELLKASSTGGRSTFEASTTTTVSSLAEHVERLHMEIERSLVKESALAVAGSLLELRDSQSSFRKWHKLSKSLLPKYVLDFGYVIPGKILSQTVNITNSGSVPVSFHANCNALAGTGFSVEFERVKNLPPGGTHIFTVNFDPCGAKALKEGCVIMPIEVTGGPMVQVQLCAVVTMPAITVSTDELLFDSVPCGMCQMKRVQLLNRESVPCQWRAAEELKSLKKVDKFLPRYQRKKLQQEQRPTPVVFEMIPNSGTLSPGETVNVQINFRPTEGHVYSRRLSVHVADSTQQVFITARGQGEEPELHFSPSVLELGPCLPASTKAEAEITVRNPCSFPVEFYSLEFDKQYLEEEKILRLMKDYEDNNLLLLPPRAPGESLPIELLEFYNEHCNQPKDDEEDDLSKEEADRKEDDTHTVTPATIFISKMNQEGSKATLRPLDITPVSRALARHMCVDLSKWLAKSSRSGIAIVVYGALRTGKSSTAAALAQHYGGPCVSVDAVVTDALAKDTTNTEPVAHLDRSDIPPDSVSAEFDVELSAKPREETSSRHNSKAPYAIDSTHIGREGVVTTVSSLLPEELLVNILVERFQVNDSCIVIDGLESAYTQSVSKTLQVVLKALNNRKHIYVVHLSMSSEALKAREKAQREAEEALQKEKADREEQWLRDLDEEEYDSLPEEQKEHIIQCIREKLQQHKLRRGSRGIAKLKDKKKQQEEVKKPNDDELKRNTKIGGKNDTKEVSRRNKWRQASADVVKRHSLSSLNESKDSDEAGLHTNTDDSQKQTDSNVVPAESPRPADKSEREKNHIILYEQIQQQVQHILQHWDSNQGLLLVPLPGEESLPVPEDAPADKQRDSAGRRNKRDHCKSVSDEADKEEDEGSPKDILCHIVVNVTGENVSSATELLKCSSLPSLREVSGDSRPRSPPNPSTVTFSLVPYPKNREDLYAQLSCDCFAFLDHSVPDEWCDKKKDLEEDTQTWVVKEEAETIASKSRKKGTYKESGVVKDKDKKGKECQSKRRMSAKNKAKASDHSPSQTTTTFDFAEQEQSQENLEQKRKQSLSTFRWVVPPKGEVVLKIWFYSDSPGKFEQTFNFELLGTQRLYQLVCRGICTYPSICSDYKTIFALTKKVQEIEEGLQKTYIIKPGYFEFGPLICSKTRDRYKENRYPENTEMLVIYNNSGLDAEVQFRFQHDTQATTYLLDPPVMSLKPEQKQELTVWAYPTKPGQMKDSILCSIKDNPEFVIINFSCWGVQPNLELESKHFHFDKTLLHRRDTRTLTLHNKTALPVSWRVQGLEELGDEFSMPQDHGIISPKSSFPLSLHFRAKKALHIKRILRLEVSDVEKILGIVHTENIQVTAEAYDIALDISPVADGCLNFGTIRVFEEKKLPVRMKNQGKYKIAYKFAFERTDPSQPKLESVFTIHPQCGSLMPHDKHETLHIICRPTTEVFIKEQPILLCQVVEPSLGNGGETIAVLSIKVSVQSVFTRYKITPVCDINFGPVTHGSKKIQSFTIENNGLFETNFTLSTIAEHALQGKARIGVKKPGEEEATEKDLARSIGATVKNRITMGVFSVFPCAGNLQPGSHQVVTVECVAEQLGNWNQGFLIDISHRDPSDQPEGIPYRLLVEVCRPVIALNMASIFEEHHLCRNSRELSSEQFHSAEGIYLLDERRFIFNNVLVGQTAQARFKLTNNSKVPCELNLAIKYGDTKAPRNVEVFNLPAKTLSIPSQSHSYAVVTFMPQKMQLYSAVFEATLEGTIRMSPTFRSKVLDFELLGEGNMPSVCVVRPALRDNKGCPVLQFRRALTGRRQTLPLVLLNNGTVPAQVQIDMLDEHGVFTLSAGPGNTCSSIFSKHLKGTTDSNHQLVHGAILRLNINEQMEFEVSFCSGKPQDVTATMSLQVQDNLYNNTIIQVTGKAYQAIVSLDNISRPSHETEEYGNFEVLDFGDCHVNCPYQESFTMVNHSSSQAVRFEWPIAGPHICFSPQVGHLHAGCSKVVTVTFNSNQPITLNRQPMKCKVIQVEFQEPLEEVCDWDDRQQTVQWLSASQKALVTPPLHGGSRVIKTDPEPCCSVIHGSQLELELDVSAVCDYVRFSCDTDTIQFKDTTLCQTQLQQLQLVNLGCVKLEFSWQVLIDASSNIVNNDQKETSQPGSHSAAAAPTATYPSSAMASLMSLLMRNPELPPFRVEPSVGTIMPGSIQEFIVHFSPLKVAQFQGRLLCSIPNLQEGDQAPSISVCGHSLLPYCHFDLEESDYISGNRRNPEFRASLDPQTRVIEFNAVGLSTPITRCFSVVNPTNTPYSFKWKCEDQGSVSFHCLTQSGAILPGKKVEMYFKYVAEQLESVESSWSFVIETLSLSFPFLFVGCAREPHVYLSRPHLLLGEILVGCRVEQTLDLVNGESEPVYFSVLQSSLLCEDQQSNIILQPMAGNVAPKDRLPLSVSFTPCREGSVSFRLVLRVKKKSAPLTLTVKADCFTMNALVQVENPNGGFRELNPNHQDTLDFGNEQSTFNFLVSNLARFNMEVTFEVSGSSELLQHLEAKPQNAVIEVGKQLKSSLFFHPQNTCNLQNVKLSIKVKHGSTFNVGIKGRAVTPRLEFSFTKFNFGKNFLYSPGMVPACQTLVISNKGKRDISIQSQFSNTSCLEMNFHPHILSPGAVIDVPLTFSPREAGHYHEKLPFILNSCVTKYVDILGQGIEMKLEVQDPKQKKVKLGSVMLGQKIKKQIVVVNRSLLDLSFSLVLSTNTPLDPKDLTISPLGELSLNASGGSCKVEIQFSPRQHIAPFTAELQAQFAGLFHPLLTIQGCCQDVEVKLDQDYLAFGAVVQRCQARKRIFMRNTGDRGARFKWEMAQFPPDLSVSPAEGYICPGMEVPFDVTFAPEQLSNDIRHENLPCLIEGSSSPAVLTVTGSCIVASTSKEVVNFICPVRGSHTQNLLVSNPTNQGCSIRPVIEGDQWSALPSMTFEPLQNKTYELTYRPLTMTTNGNKHLGSAFFSFPDGTALLYSLQGTADAPKAENTIVHELPAKTQHTEQLLVHNWLTKQQRFHVLMEILKPDKPDATVSLRGLEYIDVPALANRDYNVSFFTYREGQYNTKVTFHNEVTGEYLFYNIIFKALSPGVLSTIELVATVRRTVSATIEVENPLTTATCLSVECKCADISAPPRHTVPGQSKGSLSFEYQPQRAGKSTARLTLSSNELGYFHYDLLLKALRPPPEKTVHFSASLGSSHSVLVKFINYSRSTTEYFCKTDCPDFTVEKSITVQPGFQAGSEVSVEVCFEPHQLGEVRDLLSLSSVAGGEYIFPLHGTCLPPKAQGPFSVKAGRSVTIPFKNVFLQTTAFSFQLDNPCFTVKGVETVPSKKTQNITVSFDAPAGGPPGPWVSRLTISTQRCEGQSKPCSWVYYLKGYQMEAL